MNRLLHQAIAGKPDEIVPVANLPFDVAPLRLASACGRHWLDRSGVKRSVDGADIADCTRVDFIKKSASRKIIAPAKSRDEGQLFIARFLSTPENRTHSRGVGCHWLFAKNMFARI